VTATTTDTGTGGADLASAYRRTSYRARTPLGEIRIRIGRRNPRLDRLLERCGMTHWGYVTAVNPRSREHSAAFNHTALADLESLLRGRGYPYFPGAGRGDDEQWPAEPSFLVLLPDDAQVGWLGRRFDQVAVVAGRRGEPARLVWCVVRDSPQAW